MVFAQYNVNILKLSSVSNLKINSYNRVNVLFTSEKPFMIELCVIYLDKCVSINFGTPVDSQRQQTLL